MDAADSGNRRDALERRVVAEGMGDVHKPVTRRRFLVQGGKAVLGTSLAGAFLASCGSERSQRSELSYWSELEGAEVQRYYRENVERPFDQANQDIDFQVRFVIDTDRIVRTALQSGEGPDLVPTLGPSFALEYAQANLFLELDEYAEQYGWKDKILPWALDLGRSEGKLYSVPTRFETMLLFFNKSLFEEKGWNTPTDREEVEALAEEASGQGIIPFAAGNAEYRTSTEWFVTMFWNHFSGPDALYQALTGEIHWTDPVFVDAIDLLNRYFQRGWFGGSVERFFSTAPAEWYSQLGDGRAAMDMDGFWVTSELDNYFGEKAGNDNEWDWSPLPSLSSEVPRPIFELAIGATLSINRNSEYPDAAAEYIDWYFSDTDRVVRRMADIPAWFNVAVPIEESDFPSGIDERIKRIMLSLNEATARGNFGYATWTFWPPESDVFIIEELGSVLIGKMTPAEYCAELDRIFQQEREEGEVPPIIRPGTG
jgi:raffinose/stachyose/melibiose transport system substrate-binding protein